MPSLFPTCTFCGDTQTIPPIDDDGHDACGHDEPCPLCTDALANALLDDAVQYHQDVGDWRPMALVSDDGSDDDSVPF